MCSAHGGQIKASDPGDLELQVVVSYPTWILGTELLTPITPAPYFTWYVLKCWVALSAVRRSLERSCIHSWLAD